LATTITVTPTSVGGTVTGGTTICTGSTSGVLTLSGYTGTIVKWQSSVSPFSTWIDIANTTTTYTSGALTQATQFRAVVQSGSCSTAISVPTTVSIDPVSVGGVVTGASNVCSGSTSGQLSLSGHTGTVVKWQKSVSPFTTWSDIVNTASTYTSGALVQTTEFRAVVQSGSCSVANSAPVIVTVDPVSVGGVVNGGSTICYGSTSGTLTLAGQTGSVVKWQSSIDGFVTFNDIASTANSYISGALTQTTQFRAVVQSGSCSITNSIAATVTVSPTTVGGAVTGGSTICLGSTSSVLTLSGHTGSVVKWQSSVSPFSTWSDIANTTTTYTSGPLLQATQFRAVVQSGSCSTATSTAATVSIDPTSVGGTVTGGTAICSGSISGLLTLTGNTGSVSKWQSSTNGITWSDIAGTAGLSTYTSVALTQTTQFRAVVQSGSCSIANSVSTTVTVNPVSVGGILTPSDLGSIFLGQPIGTITLSGYTGTIVKWRERLGTGAWIDEANTASSYSDIPNAVGTWEYHVAVQSGNCPEAYSTSTYVVVQASNAGAVTGGNSPICLGTSTGTMTLGSYTGTIVKWQKSVNAGIWSDIANTTTTYSETPATAGKWEYRAVVHNSTDLFSAPASVVVDATTVGGAVTGGTTTCIGNTSGTLTLSGHTGTVLKWQSSTDGTTWSDIANTATTYSSGALSQTTYFRAVVQSGTCSVANSASTTVTISPVTVGGTVAGGATTCTGSTSGVLTLSGHTGSVIKWQSSVSPFSVWSDVANTSTIFISGALTQSTQFRAVVQSGSCSVVNSAATMVTIDPTSVGGTVTGGTAICTGTASGLLTLAGHTGAVVKWQSSTDGTTWNDISNTAATYTSEALTQTTQFRAVVQSGNCLAVNSASTTVTVNSVSIGGTILPASQADIVLGQSISTLTLYGYNGTIVKWHEKLTTDLVWSDETVTANTYADIPNAVGTWQYQVVVQSGNCSPVTSSIATVNVLTSNAGAVTGGSSPICLGASTGTMTLSGHTGTIVKWQQHVNGGAWSDIVNTSPTYSVVPPTSGVWEYRAIVRNVTDLTSAPATIDVNPTTVGGGVTGGATICNGSTSGVLTLSGQTGAVVKWQSSTDDFNTVTDIANTATTYTSGVLTQTTQFRAVVQSGNCLVANSLATTVTISPTSVGGAVTGGTTICTGSTSSILTLSGYTGTIVKWQSSVSPYSTWSDIENTTTTFTSGALTQTTQFRAVVQSGSCSIANSASTAVTIDPVSVGGVVTGGSTVCGEGTSGALTLSGHTGSILKWQSSVSPFTVWNDIANTSTTYSSGLLTQSTQFRAVVQNGTCSVTNSVPVTVTVSPASLGGVVTGGTNICSEGTSGLLTLSGQVGTVIKWQSSIDGFSTWSDIPVTSTSYSSGILTQTTQFRALVQSGQCAIANSIATNVTVYPASVGGLLTPPTLSAIALGQSIGIITLSGQTGQVVKWQERLGTGVWFDESHTATSYSDIPNAIGTWEYRTVVQSGSCPETYSSSTFVTVGPSAAGAVTGGSPSICLGASTGTMTVAGYTGTIVKWQRHVNDGTWSDLANTTTTYSEIPSSAGEWEYRAIINNGSDLTSAPTTIIVHPLSVGGTISGAKTICSANTSGTLTLTGNTGSVVKWQSSVSPFTSWTDIANSTSAYVSGALNETTHFRAVAQSGECSSANSDEVVITVIPRAVPTISGSTFVLLSSNVVTYTTEAGMTSYIWNVGSGGNITSRGTSTDNTATITWNSTGVHSISVNYTNEAGCSAGSATVKNVTVALVVPPPPPPPPPPAIPTPTITGGAGNGQVCAGTSGIVYTTEANMFNYVWTVSSGGTITSTVTSRSSSITVTWNEAGTQTIGVTYVSAWGGVPKSPGLKTIVVNPLPIPTITGQAIGCAPSDGNVYTTEPNMTGYTWAVSAGGTIASGSDTNSIIVTWNTTGPQTISVNYTDANGCSANSPTIKNVAVYVTPVPIITGISSVCVGTAGVTYTTQAGMNNYIWTVSSAGQITGGAGTNVLTVTWNATGPHTVSVNYTNESGCSAATAVIRNVTVNPLPVPTITGVAAICEASTGVSYATESGMTGYNWTISAGGTITSGAGTNNIKVTWNKPGAQTVGVNYTNPEGCTAGLATAKSVTVNPLPGVAGAITGNITLCGGTQNVVYSIAAIANVTNYNWTVPTGATIVSGAGTTSITVNYAASATPGIITANGSNPCGTSNTSSLSVNVTPLPVAAGTISGNASVCQGSTGLTFTVPPVANATSYTWSVPSGVSIRSGANTSSIVVDLAMSTTSGQITVYGSNSCAKGTTSPAFNLTVIPLPPTPVVIASGGNVSSSSSQGNQWYFSDTANGIGSAISGANSQAHTPNQNGWYWTQVTINGCLSDVSNRMYRLKAGEANRYNIYPVPNDGAFSISIITPDEQEFNITIYDQLGQKIYEVTGLIINGEFIKAIDLRPVSTGVYTVIFRNRTGNMVKKFTVNK
jgi:hypothetical protein